MCLGKCDDMSGTGKDTDWRMEAGNQLFRVDELDSSCAMTLSSAADVRQKGLHNRVPQVALFALLIPSGAKADSRGIPKAPKV
jgi:hypothetical protein